MTEGVHAREGRSAHERCPFCHDEFAASSEERVTCAGCGTPHHADCFAENGGCSSLGCERAVARLAGGAEVPVARLPDEVRYRGTRDPIALSLVAAGTMTIAIGLIFGWPPVAALGLLPLLFVAVVRIYERVLRAAIMDDEPRLQSPGRGDSLLTPHQAPLHGLDMARILNATSRARSTPADSEPSGPSVTCPGCGKTVEGSTDLAFCYHCGATLS